MRRREFIAFIGGGTALGSFSALAQQVRPKAIGFLGASTRSAMSSWIDAFVRRLHELGWDEGRNLAIEYRWAEGHTERYAEIAAEFVRMPVDVIVTYGTSAVASAKQTTSSIPIVFGGAGDPVGAGLVASLAQPGANATGMSLQQTDAAPKRLELLREALPDLSRLAIIANTASGSAMLDMKEIAEAATRLGMRPRTIEIRSTDEIAPAIEALKGQIGALYVVTDPLLFSNRVKINTLAVSARVSTMCSYREYVAAGCLMSYGPNYPELFRRTAEMVDKIFRGAKPAEIPVEQPTKFDVTLNLTTARALGLTLPQSILARADEVIE